MGRPREHDENTRTALLATAEHLLSNGEALSVRAIADGAGTTTRAVYSLFGSMDGLHQALLARGFAILAKYVRALPVTKDPVDDLVITAPAAFRRFALSHPNLFRLGFERAVPGLAPAPDAAAVMIDALKALGERVQRCKDAGLLPKRAVIKEIVWQYHALCQGLAGVELNGWLGNVESAEKLWHDAAAAFVRGLTSGSGR